MFPFNTHLRFVYFFFFLVFVTFFVFLFLGFFFDIQTVDISGFSFLKDFIIDKIRILLDAIPF